jgi:hypothetical protein
MTHTVAPGTVVMGIIDDGIAFAHERFRAAAGTTRVINWWLQDGVFTGAGTPPIPYGMQLDKSQIDYLFGQCTRNGVINEDEVYARARLADFRLPHHKSVSWRAAHGTHVMDLACGYDPSDGRDNRPIVAVQLPTRVTADTSGYSGLLLPSMINPVVQAIDYICASADRLGPNLPVVINLSYGVIAGPHNGMTSLEAAIEERIAWRKACGGQLEVILPAGNNYLSRCHASVSFPTPSSRQSLYWRVQPDDRTPSFLEIWLPPRMGVVGPSRMELTITPPVGPASPVLGEDPLTPLVLNSDSGQVIAYVIYRPSWPPSPHSSFLVVLRPTASVDTSFDTAPAGTWTITLNNKSLTAAQIVNVWIQRDDSLYGFPRGGRQSYLVDPNYNRFDPSGDDTEDDGALTGPVLRGTTINAIATGRSTIVAGGFVRKNSARAKYSSSGPGKIPLAAYPGRTGPDVLVASDDSIAHAGVLAAGSRSGSTVAMTGTSVAAPTLARWVADQIEAKGQCDRTDVQAAPGVAPPLLVVIPTWQERAGAGWLYLPPIVPR